jgi:ZIP family zinc transporter
MSNTFWVVTIAVLGPVLGSVIGVMREPKLWFMYNMLSFSAGVMLALSFLSLIPEAVASSSVGVCAAGIAVGALVMYGLDRLIPHIHPELCSQEQGSNLKKTSTYLILGIFLHNFPEGMAIAVGSVSDAKMTTLIALAIGIHNIPEGICTSAPYYHVTGNRLRAFLVSSSTALPLLAGYFTARFAAARVSPDVVGLMIGATAGLMIYISADELIPTSSFKLTNHSTIFSLMAGVLFVVLLGLA